MPGSLRAFLDASVLYPVSLRHLLARARTATASLSTKISSLTRINGRNSQRSAPIAQRIAVGVAEATSSGQIIGVRLPPTEEDDEPWTALPSRRSREPALEGELPDSVDRGTGRGFEPALEFGSGIIAQLAYEAGRRPKEDLCVRREAHFARCRRDAPVIPRNAQRPVCARCPRR